MNKEKKEYRLVTFVSKETLTNLKIAALRSDMTLQEKTKQILDRAMSKANKLSDHIEFATEEVT